MNTDFFLDTLQKELLVDYYVGVPDSQLGALCDTLFTRYGVDKQHMVAANEGAAVGLAAGHYLATGKPALIYLQNSGIGNAINPVTSLIHPAVYGIPCVFVVGWRGEPGIKDEPQHRYQGQITLEQLKLLEIDSFTLDNATAQEDFTAFIRHARTLLKQGKSIAVVVRKGGLQATQTAHYGNAFTMTREQAIKQIVTGTGDEDVFVSTTGKVSRELFEIREALGQGHEKDFLTVGSMGHASMIALGIAQGSPEKRIWCLDGDGAALMHLGSLAIAAQAGCTNLVHVVLNNQAHESVGGMPVGYGKVDFCAIAAAAGYLDSLCVSTVGELILALEKIRTAAQPSFLEVRVALGSRADLGRPTTTPQQNKEALMTFLQGGRAE